MASPHSNLEDLSIVLHWTVAPSKDMVDLANECGFVLRSAEVLEPILNSSLEGLFTLNLELYLQWPSQYYDKSDRVRTQLSQSAVEEAVKKKLSKLSGKISITVSVVEHGFE